MKKFAVIIILILILAVVFMWGGNAPGLQGIPVEETVVPTVTVEPQKIPEQIPEEPAKEVPPQPVVEELTCTLTIRCDTILNNIDWLVPEKLSLVPENGVIFSKQNIVFNENESVFDVLLREMQLNKIHMEFVKTPVYESVYIEGLNNLYEFDCGELSGWMYKVNGSFPNYGCTKHLLKNNDNIEFVYTCDLGKDVGGDYLSQKGVYNE